MNIEEYAPLVIPISSGSVKSLSDAILLHSRKYENGQYADQHCQYCVYRPAQVVCIILLLTSSPIGIFLNRPEFSLMRSYIMIVSLIGIAEYGQILPQ